MQPAPQHIRSWATGAPGELAVGESLEQIPGIVVLHDRHKPHTKANIDHIAVTPAGVWVIDAKVRPGKKLEYRDRGGMFSRDERLVVGGRDETKLIKDMAWQVEAVHEAYGEFLGNTVVRPALCFVEVTVGFLARKPWMVRGVVVAWRAVLPEILTRPGPFGPEDIDRIARRIADRLPSA
ncbi:MAG: nuclease-related domain-containing protein [Acidimicrobiales bacterium]